MTTGTTAARRLRVELRDLRVAGGLMLGAGAARAALHSTVGIPCPLRTLTGIPCPLCGMTTSVTAAMHANLVGAVAANPAGPVAVVVAVALLLIPGRNSVDVPRWLLPVGLAATWLWELFRFHIM